MKLQRFFYKTDASEKIPEKHEHITGRQYVRDLILGLKDALISVFSLVSGVVGAGLTTHNIFLVGVAAASAGALSMAISEYLSTKSQDEVYKAEKKLEKLHIRHFPDIEKNEIRTMYKAKGFDGELLDQIVDVITSDAERFLNVMMVEEFGVTRDGQRSPYIAMVTIFLAFIVGSVIPIIPFVIFEEVTTAITTSILSSSLGLLLVGCGKVYFTKSSILKSGLENMTLGLMAAGITFLIGSFLGLTI